MIHYRIYHINQWGKNKYCIGKIKKDGYWNPKRNRWEDSAIECWRADLTRLLKKFREKQTQDRMFELYIPY